MTKSANVAIEKYLVIRPEANADTESAYRFQLTALTVATILWLGLSAVLNLGFALVQGLLLITTFFYHMSVNSPGGKSYIPTELQLKAKGLDIKSGSMNAIMPWSWLTEVELRHRGFSIIPNYVFFKFKDGSDILILWEDLHAHMDTTTLISCVRTWAPKAKVRGDVQMIKSESIASYTELWLKDLNSTKSEKRLSQNQTLAEGTVLSGCYKIERILSGGGQGTAYLATVLPQTDLPDMPPQIVIKEFILPENTSGLEKAKNSLIKEVSILRRIDHPRIIHLFDFFIEDMRGYFAIEYIDGLTLRHLVEQKGTQGEGVVAGLGIALCDALSYLHGLSPPIIHGDVTPDNIMIDNAGKIKLLDFDASQELTRNKTNTVVGKHAYMSPEQFKGILSETSDIYALGCTLHFLLTGVDPEPITESCPRNFTPTVSESMNHIVSAATKFEQSQRITTLSEMRAQLERI